MGCTGNTKKSNRHSREKLTTVYYTEVAAKAEAAKIAKRPFSVSGVLKRLGVSRSGYLSFMSRTPSAGQSRRESVKKQIRKIYDESYQNYGARKIARKLNQADIRISERTVGKYMREMGIKAQWVRPWTRTTLDYDPSEKLHNILNEQFNPKAPNAA